MRDRFHNCHGKHWHCQPETTSRTFTYDDAGKLIGATESVGEHTYTYNGESYNPNIESQYLRARYYCVVTATFLTEDSYLGDITEPLTLNRYNYCVSNPLNHVDPSGNIELDIPYSEMEEAETVGEMWDLVYKYAMIEFAEIEAAHESRKAEYIIS